MSMLLLLLFSGIIMFNTIYISAGVSAIALILIREHFSE